MTAWLVVGLGNPGPTYASHRHNVGFMVVDELARRAGSGFAAPRGLRAETCETRITASGLGGVGVDAQRVVLVKPRTFMNESGAAVSKALAYFGIEPDRLVVVHDELDLDFGQLRSKFGGGDNGHNGLKSIRRSLGTGEFYRVRVGVGRPAGNRDPVNYVLTAVPASERENYEVDLARAADATVALLTLGLETTQSRFNS